MPTTTFFANHLSRASRSSTVLLLLIITGTMDAGTTKVSGRQVICAHLLTNRGLKNTVFGFLIYLKKYHVMRFRLKFHDLISPTSYNNPLFHSRRIPSSEISEIPFREAINAAKNSKSLLSE